MTSTTYLEGRVLNEIAYHEMASTNGARPDSIDAHGTPWLWVDQMADDINRPVNVVKGVVGSLVAKGFINVSEYEPGENIVCFTEAGFAAWQAVDDNRADNDGRVLLPFYMVTFYNDADNDGHSETEVAHAVFQFDGDLSEAEAHGHAMADALNVKYSGSAAVKHCEAATGFWCLDESARFYRPDEVAAFMASDDELTDEGEVVETPVDAPNTVTVMADHLLNLDGDEAAKVVVSLANLELAHEIAAEVHKRIFDRKAAPDTDVVWYNAFRDVLVAQISDDVAPPAGDLLTKVKEYRRKYQRLAEAFTAANNDFFEMCDSTQRAIERRDAAEDINRQLVDALDGLLGFLSDYPHQHAVDIQGYTDAANRAVLVARAFAKVYGPAKSAQ